MYSKACQTVLGEILVPFTRTGSRLLCSLLLVARMRHRGAPSHLTEKSTIRFQMKTPAHKVLRNAPESLMNPQSQRVVHRHKLRTNLKSARKKICKHTPLASSQMTSIKVCVFRILKLYKLSNPWLSQTESVKIRQTQNR